MGGETVGQPMTHFICGLTLRAGSLITGFFCGITALVSLIAWLCLLGSDLSLKFNDPKTYDEVYQHGAEFKSFYPVLQALLIVLSIFSIVQVAVNIILIYGTIKHIASLVNSWVMFYFLFIFLNLVSNIFIAIIAYNINSNGIVNVIMLMLRALIELTLTAYLMTVVHGHYVTMDRPTTVQQTPWKAVDLKAQPI